MPSPVGLAKYRASHLKHLAFLVGLPSTGTKPELEPLIREHIFEPNHVDGRRKIVSVDMGIRNLGICVLDVPNLTKLNLEPLQAAYKVVAWKRYDVLGRLPSHVIPSDGTSEPVASLKRGRIPKAAQTRVVNAAAFTPSRLSRTALRLSNDIIHTYKPNHILIERQRFRSGGASAVLEWTLRVNMLESMLWACLATMRDQLKGRRSAFPEVHEVSPARVARFWCSGVSREILPDPLASSVKPRAAGGNVGEAAKKKIEKSDKIAMVQSWLVKNLSLDEPTDNLLEVALEFSDEARAVADSFLTETKKSRSKRRTRNETEDTPSVGSDKLDDLADCLLQAVAFTRWEENRRRMREAFELADGVGG